MNLINRRGHRVSLAVFTPIGQFIRPGARLRWRARFKELEEVFHLPIQRFPSPPTRAKGLWNDLQLFQWWLRRYFHGSEPIILHCRGAPATHLALSIAQAEPKYRVIFDCRGLDGPEFLYVRGHKSVEHAPLTLRRAAQILDEFQRDAALKSHGVICVSEAMKEVIGGEWGVPESKISVARCCTDVDFFQAAPDRDLIRRRLRLEEHFVVAYCGSIEPWQMAQESAALFRLISHIKRDAHFLVITTQPQRMRDVMRLLQMPDEQCTIVSVPHHEVPTYLKAADISLLIRDDCLVNRVASPIKFAEYLACGLPVLITQGIGDYSEMVDREAIGVVVAAAGKLEQDQGRIASFIQQYVARPGAFRDRCINIAHQHLRWAPAIDRICDSYRKATSQTEA